MPEKYWYDFITFGWIATIIGLLLFGATMGRPKVHATFSDGFFNVFFEIDAENIGNSPAFQVELLSLLFITPVRQPENELLMGFTQQNPPSPRWQNNQKIIFPMKARPFTEYLEEEAGPSVGNLQSLKVVYAVRYQSASGNQSFVTAGEVVFGARGVIGNSKPSELQEVGLFIYYGVGYAT